MQTLHDPLEGAPWTRYVAMGDSLAEGWPDRLALTLRRQQPDLAFHNMGMRDLTTAEIHDAQLRPACGLEPDLVSITTGGDVLSERWDPEEMEYELDRIVGGLRSQGADVITFALRGIPFETRAQELNTRMRAVSARHSALFVDLEDNDFYTATVQRLAAHLGNQTKESHDHIQRHAA